MMQDCHVSETFTLSTFLLFGLGFCFHFDNLSREGEKSRGINIIAGYDPRFT